MKQKNALIGLVAVIVIIIIATAMSGGSAVQAPAEDTTTEEEKVSEATPQTPVAKPASKPAQATTASTPVVDATVTYTDAGFSPSILVVKKGDTVRFVNKSESGRLMWIAANPYLTHTSYPSLNQKASVGLDGSYTFTFTQTGKWTYHNHLENRRQGVVVVNYE